MSEIFVKNNLRLDPLASSPHVGQLVSFWFGLVWFRVTSLHLLLAGTTGELIDAYNSRDRPVKNIIVSPPMSGGTQRVRVEIGLSKTLLRSTDRKKIPC